MDARRFAALSDPFPMWRGGLLHGGRIAYETWGTLSAARDNALLLFTGLSPPAHAAASVQDPSDGWWQGMAGPKLAIDTERYFVISPNVVGGCMGSSGPASTNAATGLPWGLDFPVITVRDMVRAQAMLLDHLGIETLFAVAGGSMPASILRRCRSPIRPTARSTPRERTRCWFVTR